MSSTPSNRVLPPHRVREAIPYRARWSDGFFAIFVGISSALTGYLFGATPMWLYIVGVLSFLAGLIFGEILEGFEYAAKRRPVFTFLNRLYVALRRYARTRTAIIHSRYRVGQFVYDLNHRGCGSSIIEITAYRGKIYYRLFGFDHDYRESELSTQCPY